jgi:Nucleotide modification associated domain 2
MKGRDRCSSRMAKAGCQATQDLQTVQLFPTDGLLGKNLGLPLPLLAARIGKGEDKAYSYVVRTVRLDHDTTTFEQHGSAPNFQGDVLTLCTCKHQMRASQAAEDWRGVWLAGVTSRTIYDGKHWLFYLAKIESAYELHCDLWTGMKARSRNAKAAHVHFLGDVFKPKPPTPTSVARFSPSRYVSPLHHAHRWQDEDGWHNDWHNDIDYHLAHKYGHPPLLVADPRRTFIWNEPMIHFAEDHCRNYLKWDSVQELMRCFEELNHEQTSRPPSRRH